MTEKKTAHEEEFEQIKFEIAKIQFNSLSCKDGYIEANPATHTIALWVQSLLVREREKYAAQQSKMADDEYAFALNINNTGLSGIITMAMPPKLVCYCDEENSKIILDALSRQQSKMPTIDPHPDTEADGYVFCGKCGKMK